jgi:hypothetical protein
MVLPNTPFWGIHACLIQQARYKSMLLFGQIRQGTLPFYYINHPIYIIDLFGLDVNQPQHSLNSLRLSYLPSPVTMGFQRSEPANVLM